MLVLTALDVNENVSKSKDNKYSTQYFILLNISGHSNLIEIVIFIF